MQYLPVAKPQDTSKFGDPYLSQLFGTPNKQYAAAQGVVGSVSDAIVPRKFNRQQMAGNVQAMGMNKGFGAEDKMRQLLNRSARQNSGIEYARQQDANQQYQEMLGNLMRNSAALKSGYQAIWQSQQQAPQSNNFFSKIFGG